MTVLLNLQNAPRQQILAEAMKQLEEVLDRAYSCAGVDAVLKFSYGVIDCPEGFVDAVKAEHWVRQLPESKSHASDCGPNYSNPNSSQWTTVERLERIEEALRVLVEQRTVKDWYTTSEAAEVLAKAEWTVREWCRLGRVNADKRPCGRGKSLEWIISHAEIERIRNEGLLPDPRIIRRQPR